MTRTEWYTIEEIYILLFHSGDSLLVWEPSYRKGLIVICYAFVYVLQLHLLFQPLQFHIVPAFPIHGISISP